MLTAFAEVWRDLVPAEENRSERKNRLFRLTVVGLKASQASQKRGRRQRQHRRQRKPFHRPSAAWKERDAYSSRLSTSGNLSVASAIDVSSAEVGQNLDLRRLREHIERRDALQSVGGIEISQVAG
ncbi:hypothetical protein BH20VER3_BH20VER3_07930 [soil metagenome]